MFLNHLERNDSTSKLLRVTLRHTQMVIGSGTSLLQLLYKEHKHPVPNTWVMRLWGFMHSCNTIIKIPSLLIISLQRHDNRYLMDIGRKAGFSKSEQVNLQEATLLIQAHTLSDIFIADGKCITDGIMVAFVRELNPTFKLPPMTMIPGPNVNTMMSSLSNPSTQCYVTR